MQQQLPPSSSHDDPFPSFLGLGCATWRRREGSVGGGGCCPGRGGRGPCLEASESESGSVAAAAIGRRSRRRLSACCSCRFLARTIGFDTSVRCHLLAERESETATSEASRA